MKFVTAQQSLEEFATEVENLIQSGAYHANALLVVSLEEHVSELKSMVPIEIESVKEEDFKNSHPLDGHDLDEKEVSLYDDILRRGGYVLFEKDKEKKEVVKEEDNKEEDIGLHAPGFGVDLEEPDSDETSHEDNFNPENPNLQGDKQ